MYTTRTDYKKMEKSFKDLRDYIVAVQLRYVTTLCGTPDFVKYHLIIASSDSIFVSSVSKDFHYSFIYE